MARSATAAYEELLDLLAYEGLSRRIRAFRPSPATQKRVETLQARNRADRLTEREKAELDEFERLEHVVRLLKARIRNKRTG